MIYLASVTVLLCLLLGAMALGRRIADLLPDYFRGSVGFYISPLLGLAGLVLITTVYGWLSPFRTGISLSLFAGLLLLGLAFEKQRADLFRDWLVISAFALIATIPIFAPAIRFDSFSPFNDTFTYLVHGQWLQEHAFSETARASGFYPAESQVVLYQREGHRMGASFFLGFVQSLFHLEWSYYAYLPTVAVAFALGSLAIGGIIQQVAPVSRTVALTLCTLPAFSLNGFVFGAQYGFFPQTFGLAFAAGLACLIPGIIAYTLSARPAWKNQFLRLLPLSLCCAALLISYNDMFPLVGTGIGLFAVLVCLLYWNERYRLISSMLMLAIQALVLVNAEGVRIIKNFVDILLNAASGAFRIGWPIHWSPVQFVAHSFGMKAPFDGNVFLVDRLFSIWVFPLLLIAIVAILVKILRAKQKDLTVLLLVCINIVFWLAFLKFRYATPGLEGETGNTFLQFKLAKWLAPFNLGLLGIAIAWLLVNGTRYKRICKCTIITALMVGMAIHYVIVAQVLTLKFQNETQRTYSPFNALLDLRSRVANIPKDQLVYLMVPHEYHKITQMVAYILFDRKLATKYEDDYLRNSLPESERDMSMKKADWIIQLKPTQTVDEYPLDRVGPFLLRRAPFSFYILESVTGIYGLEAGSHKTGNWVKDFIEYRFRHIGKISKAKVKFQFFPYGNSRTLSLELSTFSGKRLASFDIPMKGGWGEYESPTIDTNSEDIVIRLTADGVPSRLSASDPREIKFLIRNFSFGDTILGTLDNEARTPETVEQYKRRTERRLRALEETISGS